ncbi:MAG TPA: hypothetical protein VG756_14055 [Pseudonocardiaceae bacterium]|jgi:hypothetical protein|nr:hypothetical protein [Pseudonocardiaceae bacterium]
MTIDGATERREYLEGGLVPVDCQACANKVLVRKASTAQTSIQWTTEAVRHCPEFAAHRAAGGASALLDRCNALRDSIELAVRKGTVVVPDDE